MGLKGKKGRKGLRGDGRGVTLVELLVVVGVFAIVGGASVGFFVATFTGRAKAHARAELQEQMRFASQRIAYEVRRARGFEATTDFGVNLATTGGATLDLDMTDAPRDPTTFDVSAGVLRIKQGAGAATALTSDEISITNLTVDDRGSANGRSKNLKIMLTGHIPDPTGSTPLDFVYTLRTTLEMRDR